MAQLIFIIAVVLAERKLEKEGKQKPSRQNEENAECRRGEQQKMRATRKDNTHTRS